MDVKQKAVEKHLEWKGKMEIISRCPVTNAEELSVAYTPGVAQPCLEIQKNPELSYQMTRRSNLVAVISDGTAVLGLGDIGPEAAMPVMEGKAVLFKEFAGVDAIPLCLDSKNVEELIRTIEMLAPSFGGINLEDISAPRCFEIEKKLKEKLQIPVFHDDQHGTAIVVSAALINALKLAGKRFGDVTIVINGAGAAGIAIAKHLISFGAGDVILCDKGGIVYDGASYINEAQQRMTVVTNRKNRQGTLADALTGADIFIGVSRPHMVTPDMVSSMAEKAIVFAMANPTPEIMPDEAKKAGAFIVGTGRSDFPNQVNNVLAFPGIFKGALEAGATDITEGMKRAASLAIAGVLTEEERNTECVLPNPFDKRVAICVAEAVKNAAIEEGVIRKALLKKELLL
ncbi:MAG: NADP-dependent malic enzyme [Oscillospiraceae bacterium]